MDNAETKILTPVKAIRAKCLDCMCGSAQEVRLCPITDCPLYPFRMGHNPNRKGKGGNFIQKSTAQLREEETEEAFESGYAFGTEIAKSMIEQLKIEWHGN